MTMDLRDLPDVQQDDYDTFTSQRFERSTDDRIASIATAPTAPTRPPVRDDWRGGAAGAAGVEPASPAGIAAAPDTRLVNDTAPTPSDSLTNPVLQGPSSAGPELSITPAPALPAPDAPAPTDFGPSVPAPRDFTTASDARIASLASPPAQPSAPFPSPSPVGSVSSPQFPPDLVAQARNAAEANGIDPSLFVQLVRQESQFNPNAMSPAGARGLTQLMPATARGLGVTDFSDTNQVLQAGARYLKQNLDRFDGDIVRALAAYNAGPGNVEKYGGVPPFAETQKYVDSIIGGYANEANNPTITPGPSVSGQPVLTPGFSASEQPGGTRAPMQDISQFGDPQLTSDEAYAACGPAAAVRFAQRFGRNPTLREATDLAAQVGWTAQRGMAGIDSEAALLNKVAPDVAVKVVRGAQWDVFAREAQTGNPVTISTQGHYFTADGFDPTTGKFHVGKSGLDLKGGAEWMSPADMQRLMGQVQGGLLADNPQVPAPSTADQDSNPMGFLGRAKDALTSGWNTVTGAVGDAASALGGTVNDALSSPFASSVQAGQEAQTRGQKEIAEGVGNFLTEDQPFARNLVGAGTRQMQANAGISSREPGAQGLTPEEQYVQARSMATGLAQTVVPEELIARGATIGAGALSKSAQVAEDLSRARQRGEGINPLDAPPIRAAAERVSLPEPVRNIPERPLPEGAQPINLTPAEETTRLRVEKFPEDVRQTIADSAEGIDWARTQRRGVIPDDVAQQMAEEYAANHTLDQVIRNGAAGKAYTTEEIRALRNATAAQAVKVNDAAAAISAGDDSSKALADFFQEGQRLQRLVQIGEGARAEAGRSLRAYRDPAQLVDLSPNDAVARITRQLGGDRQKLLDAVTQYRTMVDAGSGPVQLANFWSSIQNPVGATDWFKLIRYNSMLSGPRSFEINAVGNALELPWRFARDTGASLARLRPEELQTELTGAWAGLDMANRRFMETITQGITSEAAAKGEIPRSVSARLSTSTNPLSTVGRPVAVALEVPGRLMGAADAWANAIAYSMGMGRLAARQASREGLRGPAWTARVSHILSDPTVTPKLMEEASAMADRMTFHGEMGNFGQGLQAFTQKTGVLGNLILPFLRTVYHITARGIDRSAVGLIGTGVDVARGVYREGATLPKGVAPLGERLGDNLMGSAVFLGLYKEALDGNVSAAGPDDPGRRALLQSEGWQAYSIRVGDKWISYANWGPAAFPFALAGAAAEAQRYAKPGAQPGEIVLDGMRRTAQVVTQQTYLQAIGAAWQGLTDSQRYGFQFVNNTIGSLIPYGAAINTIGQASDPYARRPDKFDVGDAIRNRLPANTPLIGGRESVPAAQDVLGRPNPNTRAGIAAVNPLLISPERADPVLAELDATGVAPPGPPQSISRNGRQIALTPDEQRQVQSDAGGVIADRIAIEMQAPSYKALEPQARQKRLQKIIENARTQAENRFLGTLSDADYQKKIEQSQTRRELVPISGR